MLKANQRCIYLAADGVKSLRDLTVMVSEVMDGPMAPFMAGVKANDILHAKWGGASLFCSTHQLFPELGGFVDGKFADVLDTVVNTLGHYNLELPEKIATISVCCSAQTFFGVKAAQPEISIAVMGVPTDMSKAECTRRYDAEPEELMLWFLSALVAECHITSPELPFSHAISSFDMLPMFEESFPELKCIVPGIRDEWMNKGNQKRTAGVKEVLESGAGCLVLGAQLTKGNPDQGISAEKSREMTAEILQEVFKK